jgi:rRNA maturation endonuclease Nob1
MTLNNAEVDPYSPERRYYECRSCGERWTSDDPVPACESCGGNVRNIAVPRE